MRQALEGKCIGKVRAWEYLSVPLTEELPVLGLSVALRCPVVTRDRWITALAQKYLRARGAACRASFFMRWPPNPMGLAGG